MKAKPKTEDVPIPKGEFKYMPKVIDPFAKNSSKPEKKIAPPTEPEPYK